MGDLQGQTYLVTGASKGIGREVSLALARAGVRVVLLSRKSSDLERTLAEVQAISPDSYATPCDLGVSDTIEQAAQTALPAVSSLRSEPPAMAIQPGQQI